MFFVWEGNHHVTAWRRHIEHFHSEDPKWHYEIDCICLNIFGNVGVILEAIHDVNMYKIHIQFLQVVLVFEFFNFDFFF